MPPSRWVMQRPGRANARVDDHHLPALLDSVQTDTLGEGLEQGATHMEESAIRVALYAREVAPTEPDPGPSLYLQDK